MNIIQTEFKGWTNAYKVSNNSIELIFPSEVGPRVSHLSFKGEKNLFCEVEDHLGKVGGDEWRLYGGHRLWYGPEDPVRTYHPDNEPVEVQIDDQSICLRQTKEPLTGIQKEVRATLHASEPVVHVSHKLTNLGNESICLAPWALSVMAPGGRVLIPQEDFLPHPAGLLPARPLVLWPYVKMADPRYTWGDRLIQIRQKSEPGSPQKIGIRNSKGYAVYENGGVTFTKVIDYIAEGEYIDDGCNFEFFTNDFMLEVESLGPKTLLKPGEETVHNEGWLLTKGALPEDEEPLIKEMENLNQRCRELIQDTCR